MPALESTARALAGLRTATWERLAPLGVRELPLAAHLAHARGPGRSTALAATRWEIGSRRQPRAECRVVHITGATVEIVNTLILPHCPETLPVFVADLMLSGGKPRLAFLDLQGPGLLGSALEQTTLRTHRLADRYSGRQPAPAVPDWASRYSLGGLVFTRPGARDLARMFAIHDDYLQAWIELAGQAPDTMIPCPQSQATLAAFKRLHATDSPVPGFLATVFGAAWADCFLQDFLYR